MERRRDDEQWNRNMMKPGKEGWMKERRERRREMMSKGRKHGDLAKRKEETVEGRGYSREEGMGGKIRKID